MLAGALAAQGPAEAVRKAYETQIPMARIGRPEEVSEAAAWLCSDVSRYVTGISLIVVGTAVLRPRAGTRAHAA